MSNLGSSLTFVDLLSNVSRQSRFEAPSRTSWHTWSIRFAVILRKWLCLNVIKPPFLLDKLCWRSYFAPQLHIFGKHDNGHLYRIFTRSQNSFFDRLYPFSFSGRVDSHVDAHFSWLILFKQILLVGKSIIKLWSLSVLRCNFSSLILYFDFDKWSLISVDWFLYDSGLRHERGKRNSV